MLRQNIVDGDDGYWELLVRRCPNLFQCCAPPQKRRSKFPVSTPAPDSASFLALLLGIVIDPQ